MKSVNKKILLILLSAVIIVTSGCKKSYLNVNDDPNRVTDVNVTAELIFPQAENAVGVRAASGDFLFLDEWMGYYAPNGGFVPQQNIITYNIDFSFGNTLFVNQYDVLFDLHQAEVKGLAGGDTALAGASIVLSAKLFQELVDLYGDIPYSQAFQVGTITSPAYDKAQDIYASLQTRLDQAITYLQATAPKKFGAADIINHGDQDKWIKFANTLKLRLLIRQSQANGFVTPTAELSKIANTGGVLMSGESQSVNPGYSNDVNKQNPYYANFGWDPTGAVIQNAINANAYILDILQTSGDPRLGRFFYPVGFSGSSYVGNTFGDASVNLATAVNSSYFGPALVGELDASGTVGTGYSQDQFIYPSYESMFLYAEAVARGWISGDAKAAYEAAVTESFVWTGATYPPIRDVLDTKDSITFSPAESAAIYLSDSIASPANWSNAGVTPASKVNFIVYQKYIANTGIDPLESYSDERRLHFLSDKSFLSIASGAAKNLPLRLLYPQSEYTTNGANVLKEGTIDPFSTKIFWEP